MKKKIRMPLVIYACLFFSPLASFASDFDLGLSRVLDIPNPPRLIYPVTETVDITGKTFLEFKWDATDFINTRAYDFRLYIGGNTTASGLVLKQAVPHSKDSIQINADLFKDKQVYTWSIRRIGPGGLKSEPNFYSFRVIKNNG